MNKWNEKRRLRICLVGPTYPYRGGISHYNTCLAIELMKRHDVHAVNFRRLYPDFLFPGKTQYDESDNPLIIPSERIIDSLNLFTWIRAGFRIAGLRPDVTVVQWWHPYFALALFKVCQIPRIMRRGKIIFLCHNVVPHERSPVDRLLSRLAFSASQGFIVQSVEDRDNLLRIRKNARVAIHPHPIYDFFKRSDITREEARRRIDAGDEKLLLFFGYIRSYKGLRYLIEAMPSILERVNARLLVVGEFYEEKESYLSRVHELGLSHVIQFEDRYVSNEEVESFFAACDLVVLPYVSATQSGIVQIAFAFDRPVVVTDVGGLPEVVSSGKTGFIVPPSSSEALSEAVVKFFAEAWAEKMEPHFEKEKERFSWASMVDAVEELLAGM